VQLDWASDSLPPVGGAALPYGLGRSYGDSCLIDGGTQYRTRTLNRLLAFDAETGELTCEAGVSLDELFRFAVPRGWFLPVTPGTRFVTVGGAIANDVHGKNHHVAGSFGDHVDELELVRTSGERFSCGPGERSDWFRATVGGLGLTGVIVRAKIRLARVSSPAILAESVPFASLDEFFALSRDSAASTYCAAWIDCFARGSGVGRGVFFRGDHAPAGTRWRSASNWHPRVPFSLPGWVMGGFTMRCFNAAYRFAHRRRTPPRAQSWQGFLHPLDGIRDWNRIYGRNGFLQWQCVVPHERAQDSIAEILGTVAHARQGSCLAVLKVFGDRAAPGLLSFPRPGTTLALDFSLSDPRTFGLLDRLDAVVMAAGGALYPAKDARMAPATFRASFAQLEAFRAFRDPGLRSAFWKRVEGDS
jgi:FAD/FMN-containing dehydrogenase